MNARLLRIGVILTAAVASSASAQDDAPSIRASLQALPASAKVQLTNEQWRRILTPAQFAVLRQAATEPPFQNEYASSHASGTYCCGACATELFSSAAKYDSGTGWPSFTAPLQKQRIRLATDRSNGQTRQEVLCARCDSHLGHLFKDGPPPARLRYCLNSAALQLKPATHQTGSAR